VLFTFYVWYMSDAYTKEADVPCLVCVDDSVDFNYISIP